MQITIFLFENITALDVVGTYESLARIPAAEIICLAETAGPVRTGDRFLALHADADISSVRTADILIVPGGHGRGLAATIPDREINNWIREVDATGR